MSEIARFKVQPSRNKLTISHGTDKHGNPALEVLGPREYALSQADAFRLADALVDAAEALASGSEILTRSSTKDEG